MKIRKFLFMVVIVLILAVFWSCGLKIPGKLPSKVGVKYTKHIEFPITTMKISMENLVNPMIEDAQQSGFQVVNRNPLTLSYGTSVVISPVSLLGDIENQIKNSINGFSQTLSFQINTDEIFSNITTLNGSISLPGFSPISGDIAAKSANIGDIEIVNSVDVPVVAGTSVYIDLGTLSFDFTWIHVVSAILEISTSVVDGNVDVSEIELVLGTVPSIKPGEINDMYFYDGDMVGINATITGAGAGTVRVSITLKNVVIDEAKGIDMDKYPVTINIPDTHIDISPENWQITLSGIFVTNFTVDATNLKVVKNIEVTSGGATVASGDPVVFDSSKIITVSNGLDVTGTITLKGTPVDIDLKTPITYEIVPDINIESIKNYPVDTALFIPLPDNVDMTKIGTGTFNVEFLGITINEATGTLTDGTITRNVQISGNVLSIDAAGIELPATLTLNQISASVDNGVSKIDYTGHLSNDFAIEKVVVSPTLLASAAQNVNIDVSDLAQFVNSLDATIVINVSYVATGISNLTISATSNILEDKTIVISGTGESSITNDVKTIDFSTLNSIDFSIEASGDLVLSNIEKGKDYGVDVTITMPIFEVDKVDLKGQKYTFGDPITLFDFSNLGQDLEFLKNMDLAFSAPVTFKSTNTTIEATITLDISGTPVSISIGGSTDISEIIKQVLKDGALLTLSISIETSQGILSKDSEFGVDTSLIFAFEGTPNVNTVVADGYVDLLDLKGLAEIIDSATLTFAYWKNTTGLKTVFNIGGINFNIGTATPALNLNKEQINSLASDNTYYSIILPAGEKVSLNADGCIDVAPYISVDLTVATQVTF
ncbi:hypothetical protein JYK00_03610 [Thermosipho ferrireducens]|uniref:Lipoprotein n=1 Tax=Thermosipho ferrireducens TaxID=2571116 RepID=A0ABX7S8T6_9BACT|nr:hypothetical protein [Thermosipho ferrireducens]QTA38609.1 hypothetical protein JYK00_03610 [Thermosipho ferrireducens]